jgi:ketosteroid isomerase-like protein
MKFASLLVILMCITAASVVAQDDVSLTKSEILALDEAWNDAYKLADTKAVDAILDNAVVLVNDDGSTQSKAEFLASLKSASLPERQISRESLTVHVFGISAIASGLLHVKGVENGKSYIRKERFIDTWISKSGRWVCVATAVTQVFQ